MPGEKEGVNADPGEPHSHPSPQQSHLWGREVGDGDLERLQDSHGAGGLLVQHLPSTRLQEMRLHRCLGHRHTNLQDSLLSPHCAGDTSSCPHPILSPAPTRAQKLLMASGGKPRRRRAVSVKSRGSSQSLRRHTPV